MAVFKYEKRADWTAANPVLQAGECGFEADTGNRKIGNGKDSWQRLPYCGAPGYWGEFTSASSQTASANTPTEVTFADSVAGATKEITLLNNSQIKVSHAGVYVFEIVLHLKNDDTQIHDAAFWLRKNNNSSAGDMPLTTLSVSVIESHGGVPGRATAALDHTLTLDAGDYIELIWATSDVNISITGAAATTSPYARPTAPSAVCNVFQVASA
jgi:hypothetical protein